MKRREKSSEKFNDTKVRCECCMIQYRYKIMHKHQGFWLCDTCYKDVKEEDDRLKNNLKHYGVTGFAGSQVIEFDKEEVQEALETNENKADLND